MKTKGIVCAAGLAVLTALGCSSSSGGAAGMEATDSGGAFTDGPGAGTEQQILCLGSFYCNPGTVCCGTTATSSSACSTGPVCPLGALQLCMTDSDCGGGMCTMFTFMGISAGTCADLGGLLGGPGDDDAGGGDSGGADGAAPSDAPVD